ncbi:YitT family protein [Paenibacillus tarimensis]
MKNNWMKMFVVVIGCVMIASSIHFLIYPHKMIEGGMLGVGLLVSYAVDVPTGLAIFLLSFPIYCFAWFFSKSLIWRNLFGICIIAFLLDILEWFPNEPSFPPLASALLGGTLIGAGVGLLLVCDITTDGMDLLANLLSYKTKINVGIIIFIFDVVILFGGTIVLDRSETMLSGITVASIGFMTTFITMNKSRLLSS